MRGSPHLWRYLSYVGHLRHLLSWQAAVVKACDGNTVVTQHGSKLRVRGPARPELAGRTGIEVDDAGP